MISLANHTASHPYDMAIGGTGVFDYAIEHAMENVSANLSTFGTVGTVGTFGTACGTAGTAGSAGTAGCSSNCGIATSSTSPSPQ